MRTQPAASEDLITPRSRRQLSTPHIPPDPSSDTANAEEHGRFPRNIHQSFAQRLEHFTWAWFTVTMSTGGLAIAIAGLPFKFNGLIGLGTIVYVFNLVLFVTFACLISFRFWRYRWTLRASFVHPTESLFVAAGFLSIATIILGMNAFGDSKTGDWLQVGLRIMFWMYSAAAVLFTVAIHIIIWSTQTHTVSHMTPLWILPIYPLLLVGPLAGSIAPGQDQTQALDIFIAGVALQGIGFMISLMIYAAYISRLMTAKLPIAPARPGMFVSVGPSAFTVIALIKLGQAAVHAFPPKLLGDGALMARVVEIGATVCGLWLWGLSCWFFLISLVANFGAIVKGNLHYSLGWWGFLFPNTALVLATLAIGGALKSRAIEIVGTVLAAGLVVLWIFLLGMTVRGLKKKQILWKDQGEDRDEGGYHSKGRGGRKGVHEAA